MQGMVSKGRTKSIERIGKVPHPLRRRRITCGIVKTR